jgi:hypothetical protein
MSSVDLREACMTLSPYIVLIKWPRMLVWRVDLAASWIKSFTLPRRILDGFQAHPELYALLLYRLEVYVPPILRVFL